jgi:hypothetical protein
MVRLKSERMGLRLATRPEWIEEFIERCSGERTEPSEATQRMSGQSAAMRFLTAEGLYEAPRKVLDQKVSAGGSRLRSVSSVLPDSTANDRREVSHKRGVD